ncbi:MAG: thioredoxin domain-containing protein [Alphaproteobacteria bacterium]|nr:thioredoxin domain-containing protein [Alphaproteobacteria bacterium]
MSDPHRPDDRPTNRLAHASSPYLRQHAHNPVDWYPWGDEALDRAEALQRPILLSVGYAACHWCHVMEHESFSDAATAAFMNEHFVAVKVDREERPDLDAVYMSAVQAFTGGHGGWPMTLFLMPDGRPFLGGTYFPPEPRHGMPSFRQVMAQAIHLFTEDTDRRDELAEAVTEHVASREVVPELRGAPSRDWLAAVAGAASGLFDSERGGFGGAPKFPPHGTLAALLAHHATAGDADASTMAVETLDAMARGGMNDVLGGGFARYSVDADWLVPHFEKMLYDNAQLIPLYVDAWRMTGAARMARVARETVGWMLRDARGPEGAFYASEDADSEGEEGRYYVWTPAQLDAVLGADGPAMARLLGVTPRGTFEHGTSVLRLERPEEDLPADLRARWHHARPLLLAARGARVRPGTDIKRITAWNALAVRALAVAGAALDEPAWVDQAVRTARFLRDEATVDGRLQRIWTEHQVHVPGFLDDHAFLVLALVDLAEATLDVTWLRHALDLARTTLDLFWDEAGGTALYVGRDATTPLATPRKLVGGAEPSGNGVLAWALARLAVLCDRPDLGAVADRILDAYAPFAARAPMAVGYESLAWAWRQAPVREVGLVLPHAGADTAPMRRAIEAAATPFRAVAAVVAGQVPEELPWMADRPALDGAVTAYVCERGACQAPTTDPAQVTALLSTR